MVDPMPERARRIKSALPLLQNNRLTANCYESFCRGTGTVRLRRCQSRISRWTRVLPFMRWDEIDRIIARNGLIPVRHRLQPFLFDHVDAAHIRDVSKGSPNFPTAIRQEKRLSSIRMMMGGMCRMIKRRMKDPALPARLSAHCFRVATITEPLEQGIPLEDVQHRANLRATIRTPSKENHPKRRKTHLHFDAPCRGMRFIK